MVGSGRAGWGERGGDGVGRPVAGRAVGRRPPGPAPQVLSRSPHAESPPVPHQQPPPSRPPGRGRRPAPPDRRRDRRCDPRPVQGRVRPGVAGAPAIDDDVQRDRVVHLRRRCRGGRPAALPRRDLRGDRHPAGDGDHAGGADQHDPLPGPDRGRRREPVQDLHHRRLGRLGHLDRRHRHHDRRPVAVLGERHLRLGQHRRGGPLQREHCRRRGGPGRPRQRQRQPDRAAVGPGAELDRPPAGPRERVPDRRRGDGQRQPDDRPAEQLRQLPGRRDRLRAGVLRRERQRVLRRGRPDRQPVPGRVGPGVQDDRPPGRRRPHGRRRGGHLDRRRPAPLRQLHRHRRPPPVQHDRPGRDRRGRHGRRPPVRDRLRHDRRRDPGRDARRQPGGRQRRRRPGRHDQRPERRDDRLGRRPDRRHVLQPRRHGRPDRDRTRGVELHRQRVQLVRGLPAQQHDQRRPGPGVVPDGQRHHRRPDRRLQRQPDLRGRRRRHPPGHRPGTDDRHQRLLRHGLPGRPDVHRLDHRRGRRRHLRPRRPAGRVQRRGRHRPGPDHGRPPRPVPVRRGGADHGPGPDRVRVDHHRDR